ncbi:MAG: nuclear transport factor 2 family protein [Acidobacteriia bacterium]|nr:nuclear transport factor 2 family protein [Terriglobia bacterium]
MSNRLALIVLLLASTLACNMWSKPASGWTGATGGEQIEKLFWQDVQAKNWAEVDRHVADTFAGTGPGGTTDRAAFLRDLQKAPLTDFSLSECNSHLNGADMVVTCTLQAQWAGQPSTASTLSVWQQLKKGWVMVAHSESKLAGS